MNSFTFGKWSHLALTLGLIAMITVGVSLASPVFAAPPYSVGYEGASTTTAVPGKPTTINFKVTNTGTTVYSGVKVIFHIPNGMSHSTITPANATITDDAITWINVPIKAGKSFYPSITLTIDSGTKLKTKKNIWVQITGDSMEENSQNFSVIAVASTTTATTSSSTSGLIPKINSIHRIVYGINPSASQHAYWLSRVTNGDKTTYGALLGAMQYHNQNNITH